jgi:anthranilate synthase component II
MTTKILLVDNYDSFTYNLAQAFGALGADVTVLRADDPALASALDARPDRLVISPGPGRPEAAGRSPRLVREGPERGIPTLGVCLGLQCAAVAFGASVVRAPEPRHGKTSLVRHDGKGVFVGVPDPTEATRYHSLMVDERTLPPASVASSRGRAVPPGVGHDRRGDAHAGELRWTRVKPSGSSQAAAPSLVRRRARQWHR